MYSLCVKKPPKFSHQSRLIYLKRQKKKFRYIITKRQERKARRGLKTFYSKEERIKHKTQSEIIALPKSLDIHNHSDDTFGKIAQLNNAISKQHSTLRQIDFSVMSFLDLSSALMLAAEIDLWNRKRNKRIRARDETWQDDVKYLLSDLGFFELLSLEKPGLTSSAVDTKFLKFTTGNTVEGEKAGELKLKINEMMDTSLGEKQGLDLYDGLIEACTNTIQHAYFKNMNKEYKRWWLSAAYRNNKKELIISLYDRGLTIPKTVHKYNKWEEVKLLLKEGDLMQSDSHLISSAVKVSYDSRKEESNQKPRTRTRELYRGKGLGQFLEFVENRQGQVCIVSGKGYCVFSAKDQVMKIKKRKSLKYPLPGTLVEWRLTL